MPSVFPLLNYTHSIAACSPKGDIRQQHIFIISRALSAYVLLNGVHHLADILEAVDLTERELDVKCLLDG